MMLTRVISIKNVGRFRNSAHTANPSLAKYTLIYGANGYGKTTLCSVLRSIESGDTAPLVGRKTLGSTTPQEIDLLFAEGSKRLRGNAWSDTAPNISVFDGVFYRAECSFGRRRRHRPETQSLPRHRRSRGSWLGRGGTSPRRTGSRHPKPNSLPPSA